MYSIKAISSLTGISADTLRAWERRYECIHPERGSNGHRSYSQQDLDKIKLLIALTKNGHAIGKIAGLSLDQLRGYQSEGIDCLDHDLAILFNQIIDALLHYRLECCERILKRAMLAYQPFDYAKDILSPVLHQVTQLHREKKINAAQKQLFFNCVKRIVFAMINQFPTNPASGPAIMFATLTGDHDEFGILLSYLIAGSLQCNCYYLGVDLPAGDIFDAYQYIQPYILLLGIANIPQQKSTINQLTELLNSAGDNSPYIWLVGTEAENIDSLSFIKQRYNLITDLDNFYSEVLQLRFSNES